MGSDCVEVIRSRIWGRDGADLYGICAWKHKNSTNWVVKVFEQWRAQRNATTNNNGKLYPSNVLDCPKACELNYWLSQFVVEARREDGNPYPARTLSNLLAGLYRHCRESDATCPNFMNHKDPVFKELSGAIQVWSRELYEAGVGAVVKHTSVISTEEENALWEWVLQDVSTQNLARLFWSARILQNFCMGKSNIVVQDFAGCLARSCWTSCKIVQNFLQDCAGFLARSCRISCQILLDVLQDLARIHALTSLSY